MTPTSQNHTEFIELLRPHYNDALRFCISLTVGDPSKEPQDILQDALIKALKNFPRLKEKDSFRPWLFQIIIRIHRSAFRLSLWKRFSPFDSGIDSIPGTDLTDSRLVVHQELHHYLQGLTAKEREAVILFEIGGFSLDEIRRIQQDKSVSAVKSRLKRARERMSQRAYEGTGKTPTRSLEMPLKSPLTREILLTTDRALEKLNEK